MGNNIICQRKPQDHIHVKQIDENARPGARLEDLPQDLVYKILSKLPPNEAAKTSGLSSKWRCIWSKCPRLCFDGLAMFKCERGDGLAMVLPSGSLSGLQHVQLCFVSIKPPSKFRGFPNLRKLDLQLLDVTSKDLETTLSNCISLEWLSIDRCHLNDELRVGSPLPRLVYLQVVYCQVTKIQFHAVEVATFVYKGDFVPIALEHSLKLENAYIKFNSLNDWHAISDLVKGLPNLRNLNFHLSWNDVETELLWDTPWKFSHLRHLRLENFADSGIMETNFLVSFLRAAPFIEKLEIHFCISLLPLDVSHEDHPVRQQFGRCEYNNLKNVHITGYKGSIDQVEFLLYVVENAPALEVLTIEVAGIQYQEVSFLVNNSAWVDRIAQNAEKYAVTSPQYLSEKLSSKTEL